MRIAIAILVSMFSHLSFGIASDDHIVLDGNKVNKGTVEHLNFVDDAYNVQSGLCFSKPNKTVCRGARMLALRDESSSRRLVNDLLQKLRKACAEGSKLHCNEQTELEKIFGISPSDPEIRK